MKPRWKVQSCVAYWVCCGTRGVVLYMSRDVKIRILLGGIIREEKRKEVEGGRSDKYTRVPALAWFKAALECFVG
jgi:hypothetical protein